MRNSGRAMTIASIDVRSLLGNPGAHRREALRGTLEDLGTEVAWVPSDEPITGDVLLESIVEGLLVSGRLSGTFQIRCARCLKDAVHHRLRDVGRFEHRLRVLAHAFDDRDVIEFLEAPCAPARLRSASGERK